MSSSPRLVVCLKDPAAGHVKTRLGRDIGQEEAAAYYRAFLADTLLWAARFPCEERIAYFTPRDACLQGLRALLPAGGAEAFRFVAQPDGTLGDRLATAFEAAFAQGRQGPCIVVGTDCPLLGPARIREGLELLRSADVVLTPALDGGYCMMGLRAHHPGLFEGIPWSTDRVLEATVDRARVAGLAVSMTAAERDVDTGADLWEVRKEILALRELGAWEGFPEQTYERLLRLRSSP